MADTNKYIAKIKLSDNSVYYIKDLNALHLSGGTLTGDLEVDAKLKAHDLYILETEYLTETQTPTNVLVLDEETGQVKKRSTNNLLKDIGGVSYSIDEASGTLSLKLGTGVCPKTPYSLSAPRHFVLAKWFLSHTKSFSSGIFLLGLKPA